MSRSGYSEDCENLELWRGAVNSAIRGRRGQALLRDLLTALDAMPEKVLIADELIDSEGAVCALGSVGVRRGLDMSSIDPHDAEAVAAAFKIAPALAKEIEFINDDEWCYGETPQARWARVRAWVAAHIVPEAQ